MNFKLLVSDEGLHKGFIKQLKDELITSNKLLDDKNSRTKSAITKKLFHLIKTSLGFAKKNYCNRGTFNINHFLSIFLQKASACYLRMDDVEDLFSEYSLRKE